MERTLSRCALPSVPLIGALSHVLEWSTLHRQELLDIWALARASRPLPRVEPLE